MASNFTPNKGIEQPLAGSYPDTWATPANNDYAIIDTCFGGSTQINVTGIASGTYTLTVQQYQPPNIVFTGTLSGNLVYVIPDGVGGLWTFYNATSGAYSVTLYYPFGSAYLLTQGARSLVVGDGANLEAADTAVAASQAATAQENAEAYAAEQAATAQSNAESYAAEQAVTAQSNAETYAAAQAATAQSNAETYAAAQASAAQNAAEAYSRSLYRAGTFTAINGVQTVTFSSEFATGITPIVVTQWNYASPNVGWVTPGSISNTGFTYTNSNGGTCDYIAYVAN